MNSLIFRCLPLLLLAGSVSLAAPTELSIRFEEQPVEEGLQLHREGLAYAQQGGRPAWVSRHRSVPINEWARSFLLTVTDPAARDGQKPIVEGEIVYWHNANTAVEVLMDTQSGSRKVAESWGNKAEWQTLRFKVDDAFFGSREHGNPADQLPTDGFDLRINASAGDFFLAEVRLTAFAPSEYIDYSATLKPAGVQSSTGHFYSDEGQAAKLTFSVTNEGAQAFQGDARTVLVDWQGKAIRRNVQPITIEVGKTATVDVAIPADLSPDVYLAAVELQANGVSGPRGGPTLTQSFVVARPDEIFIVLDNDPIARGIEVEPQATSRAAIPQGLAQHPVWIAEGGSSELPWGRAMRFRITDERFKAGGQPAVDLDVIYRQTANAPVNIVFDTKNGPRKVADGWGRNAEFQRTRREIDDAFFGAREGGEGEETLRGHDIRINSYNEPLAIRALRLRGYETAGRVDLSRLLRFEGVRGPRPILVSPQDTEETIRYAFRNISQKDVELAYRFVLTGWDDRELDSKTGTTRVAANGTLEVPYVFRTHGLTRGVYHIRLELAHADAPATPVFTYDTNIGVSPVDALPRAKSGEFLYGMDSGETFSWDWLDFMGVDITRRFPTPMPPPDQVADYLAEYEKRGMSSMIEADPPGWNPDPNVRKAEAEQRAAYAADLAKRFKGRLRYWELGNEPDLTFFYAGPMTDYSEVHSIIARAILKEDPDAVVMNGGLSFAGEEGDRRAREFVKIVPGDTIVGWAYHAHGPGVGAERMAWQRMVDVAKAAGKDRMPLYIETESGVAAVTKPQQIVQAATAIQKMVFAQSVKMPLFIWFRNYITGGDGAYTNLKTPQEPRPVAISYRAMVENLRGLHHAQMVDLRSPDAEAHYFESKDGKRRALVLWCNQDTTLTVNIGLAESGATTSNVRLIDLFGNGQRVEVFADGTVPVTVTPRPVFLTWDSSAAPGAGRVAVKESLIKVPRRQQLFAGLPSTMNVHVRNPSAQPLTLDLVASAPSDPTLSIAPERQTLTIPAAGETDVPLTLKAEAGTSIQWPVEWTAFLNVHADNLQLAGLTELPASLPGETGEAKPRILLLRENRLNLQKVVDGPVRERRCAVVFGEIDSPIDQTVRIGAAADWWFSCWVNGRQVYSTMDRGNGGPQTLLAHTFDLPLQKGRNLIAFQVLSGSMGFQLVTGGPDELRAILQGTSSGRTVELALERNGQQIARQVTTLAVLQPPPALPENFWGSAAQWFKSPPQFAFESVRLRNPNEAQPDSRFWFKGPEDLSAVGWITRTNERVYLVVRVKDDIHAPAQSAAQAGDADRLEIQAAEPGDRVFSTSIAAGPSGAVITPGLSPLPVTKAEVVRQNQQTLYMVELDAANLTALNLRVHDSDDTANKQTLTWLDGWSDGGKKDTAYWFDLSSSKAP
ncbi:MAG: hypothetical protein SFU53_14520 [Terrimicrobiaceae bacterium]|nr:hypothetical protein [Terrimicrobiaceae bacterium]